MIEHVVYFLLITLLTAFVSALLRGRDPKEIARETWGFFWTVSAGVMAFGAVVYALEQLFIHPTS